MSIKQKVVVIGGTGLIGSKAVAILREDGHEVIAASLGNGIDAFTGEGLEEAISGADAVIDVSNMMSFDGPVIRNFFDTTSRNLTTVEKASGVRHHVVLSIVGTDGLVANPYMSGKQAQEAAVKASGQNYTIVRATQFHEFLETLAGAYAVDNTVRVPAIDFQPIAADDVAAALVSVALGEPQNRTIEVAGPERAPFEVLMGQYLKAQGDQRIVVSDSSLGYFGAAVDRTSLVPNGEALSGAITLTEWLHRQARAKIEESV